jgi:hypothetical protein
MLKIFDFLSVVSGMKIANRFFFSGKEAKALLFLE